MAQPRKRVFGPLFYSTAVLAVLVLIYVGISVLMPSLHEYRERQMLVESLRSSDPNERIAAMSRLANLVDENGPPQDLLDAATDTRPDVRALAIRTLANMPRSAKIVLPLLSAATKDPQDEVRLEAVGGLGRLGVFALQSGNGLAPEVRSECVRLLQVCLNDASVEVRVAAANSLGELGSIPEASAALVAALGDKEREVQIAAARSLLRINGPADPDAARTLLHLIATPEPLPPRDPVSKVRTRGSASPVSMSLPGGGTGLMMGGGMASPGSSPQSTSDLKDIVVVLNAATPEVQDQAIAAIVKLLGSQDPSICIDASEALKEFGSRATAALPALDVLLKSTEPDVRAIAGKAVAAIEGKASPRSIAIQIETILDTTLPHDWRLAALQAVREVNAPALASATPTLIRQLTDADPNIRMYAHQLLGEILYDTPAVLPEPSPSATKTAPAVTAP